MKKRILAMVLCLVTVVAVTVPAWAALTRKTIDVDTNVSIYVDGIEMKPTDANGKPVDTFIYNGTTYVPLRAVSQYLGKNVSWDGTNRRAYIGERPGEKQYLLTVCPPYQTHGTETPATITMAGKKYANCIYWRNLDNYAIFNLNGEYNRLEFDAGHIDGQHMCDATLNIYLDGELSFSADLTAEMLPTRYSVPLYGALQMKIEVKAGNYNSYGFGNVEIY